MKIRKFLVQLVLQDGQELTADGRQLLDSVAGWVATGLAFHSGGRSPVVFVTEEEKKEEGAMATVTTKGPVSLDGEHFSAHE